jgi:HEAT repeat protein
VAAAAIRALTELGEPDPALLEHASRHPDPEVVKEAVWAAAGVPAAAAAAVLVAAAAHARWDVRRAAAQAIAARGDRSLLETVRRLGAAEEDPMAAEAFADAGRALAAR